MYLDEFKHQLPDIDDRETSDWIESRDDVLDQEGETRARFLLFKLLKRARQRQVGLPPLTNTRYINTISPEQEPFFPGDEQLERRIRRPRTACRRPRPRGSCPTSGSFRLSRWASARSRRSTRPGSTGTSRTAASWTHRDRASGPSWATARRTSRRPSGPSTSQPARASTT